MVCRPLTNTNLLNPNGQCECSWFFLNITSFSCKWKLIFIHVYICGNDTSIFMKYMALCIICGIQWKQDKLLLFWFLSWVVLPFSRLVFYAGQPWNPCLTNKVSSMIALSYQISLSELDFDLQITIAFALHLFSWFILLLG